LGDRGAAVHITGCRTHRKLGERRVYGGNLDCQGGVLIDQRRGDRRAAADDRCFRHYARPRRTLSRGPGVPGGLSDTEWGVLALEEGTGDTGVLHTPCPAEDGALELSLGGNNSWANRGGTPLSRTADWMMGPRPINQTARWVRQVLCAPAYFTVCF